MQLGCRNRSSHERQKTRVAFKIHPDSFEMLLRAAKQYRIPDPSKALRCLLDYAATEGDWDPIFGKMRCRGCVHSYIAGARSPRLRALSPSSPASNTSSCCRAKIDV